MLAISSSDWNSEVSWSRARSITQVSGQQETDSRVVLRAFGEWRVLTAE